MTRRRLRSKELEAFSRIEDKNGLPQIALYLSEEETRVFSLIEQPLNVYGNKWNARALQDGGLCWVDWECDRHPFEGEFVHPKRIVPFAVMAWVPLGSGARNPESCVEGLEAYLTERGVLDESEAYQWDDTNADLSVAVANEYAASLGLEGKTSAHDIYVSFIADNEDEQDSYYEPDDRILDGLMEALDRVLAKEGREWLWVNENARPLNALIRRLNEAGDRETLEALRGNLYESSLSIASRKILN